MSNYGGLGKDYICPVCGKTFSVPFQTKGGGRTKWTYARRKKNGRKEYLCTYSCTRIWDERKDGEKQ